MNTFSALLRLAAAGVGHLARPHPNESEEGSPDCVSGLSNCTPPHAHACSYCGGLPELQSICPRCGGEEKR